MGDNELIEEVVSPTESQSVDLSPIIDSLNDLIVTQGEIIENQKKIINYFFCFTSSSICKSVKDKINNSQQIPHHIQASLSHAKAQFKNA